MEKLYYIADLRVEWTRRPYIIFWRSDFAGYCYSLPWAGLYGEDVVIKRGDYLTRRRWSVSKGSHSGVWERFGVLKEVVEGIAKAPARGIIDGDVGPVVSNNKETRDFLRREMFRLPRLAKEGVAA